VLLGGGICDDQIFKKVLLQADVSGTGEISMEHFQKLVSEI
jgi:Ca2+-binding EF-hand superfamily protein